MRVVLSTLLFLHGLVHVVGFIGPLELITSAPFQSTVLGQRVANESPLVRCLAMLWLLCALAFSIASVASFQLASWWLPFTACVILASMLLCLTAWPMAKVGLLMNAGLLLALLSVRHASLWVDLLALMRAWS